METSECLLTRYLQPLSLLLLLPLLGRDHVPIDAVSLRRHLIERRKRNVLRLADAFSAERQRLARHWFNPLINIAAIRDQCPHGWWFDVVQVALPFYVRRLGVLRSQLPCQHNRAVTDRHAVWVVGH